MPPLLLIAPFLYHCTASLSLGPPARCPPPQYITDSGISIHHGDPVQGGLIVYDIGKDTARRVLNAVSCGGNTEAARSFRSLTPPQVPSTQADTDYRIVINGDAVLPDNKGGPMMTGADGIALTPDCYYLYYCPLTSDLYVGTLFSA